MDYARTHYRDNFQINIQLLSTKDWAAVLEYWKWTGDIHQTNNSENNIPDRHPHRFHLVTSIQDLSDDAKRLSSELKKSKNHHHKFQSIQEIHHRHDRKTSSRKQDRIFLPHPRS
ncbi:unnamed protein product, partial [Rotaria sp. Silwood1]